MAGPLVAAPFELSEFPPVPESSQLPQLDPDLITGSLGSMTAGPQTCAGDFYGYLFAAQPGLRGMFPPQMSVQNERLFGALVRIVSLLGKPYLLAGYLAQLGADHRKYGVSPEHYMPVGDALIRALRRHCKTWDESTERAWMTAYSMAADMMITGAEAQTGPAAWRCQVVRHERRTHDLAVVTVRPDQPLPYEAGQYVTVQTPRWPQVWRHFSVANAPAADGLIDLHIRAVPAGWVSNTLVSLTSPGDEILLGPAAGEMTADTANGSDLVCVAGGTGLAPLRAIVEEVLRSDEENVAAGTGVRRNISLFHGARDPLGFYDMPGLRELSSSYPWFQVVPVISGDHDFGGLRGNVAEIAVKHGDWSERHAFISGPEGMVRDAVLGFQAAEVPDAQVHYDGIEVGDA
jgi:NAD(P)H-flavin reductase/hemoglobin-like flavoprotein